MTERLTREEEREIVNAEKRAQDDRRREAQAERKRSAAAKRPEQSRLPGTDGKLGQLEQLAEEYFDCGKRRAQLKLDLLDEMKRLKKKHYEYNGLEVTVVEGTESVRVKVQRDDEEGSE
jgi:hypothetical protein